MNKLTILFLTTIILYSCSWTKTETGELRTRIVVNADSCKKWGLDPVTFEVEYPSSYKAELNSSGGFYLQLRKVDGDTILQEISFGKSGGLTPENLEANLNYADSVTNTIFIDGGQKYTTDFIGTEEFLGQQIPLARATINLKNVPREGLVANGDYSTLMTCLFSNKYPGQSLMISVISNLNEPVDHKNKLGLENGEILNTLRVE